MVITINKGIIIIGGEKGNAKKNGVIKYLSSPANSSADVEGARSHPTTRKNKVFESRKSRIQTVNFGFQGLSVDLRESSVTKLFGIGRVKRGGNS